MLPLYETTDKLQLITSAAADVDVTGSYVEATKVLPSEVDGDQIRPVGVAITTATTTDIVAVPSASTRVRNIKELMIRNKDAADSTTVTVVLNRNAVLFEIYKAILAPGEALAYGDGYGWFELKNQSKLNDLFVTTADVVNATTSFADITGLTCAVEAGKTYMVEAAIIHVNNASTTGSRFGFGGPAMTYVVASTIDTVTPSVTASAHSAGTVTALETAITAQTTGATANRLAIIEGVIVPSADGVFAIRCQSEIAVAAGLTVRRGSRLHIREADNT